MQRRGVRQLLLLLLLLLPPPPLWSSHSSPLFMHMCLS
ncbi:hypothetical protein, unknown function [Leishmania mexicana MHOM/GT/2001/U1103]|uniref:Uncharacterized protein n=1 Tax=Leishmania mexicana (strain MHOM/GT/2001/U1103) TaxID=929439 RepID=E9AKD8_LEIMU|nr:hypothetical protein, unknown function [Leishmania mexicana MHOM/GT/2001/U1103]CBZ23389.1 hypothetical protein, unknown function [Leishmania mexicana MHOM/GT/2001/U1103]